jgi:hypothetical protein
MPREQIQKFVEYLGLNLANGVFLLKDWLLINIGAGVSSKVLEPSLMDSWITKGIGLSLIVFNIVRIVKWILDIKERNDAR